MAGAAALGLRAAFVGQVADDQLGAIFAHDMRSLGVRFETAPLQDDLPTGRCLILVTPDAQRTMNTCPGASHELTTQALDPELIRSAAITFLEGYLWGPERPRAAMLEAAASRMKPAARLRSRLSESLCIGDRREGVMGMIDAGLVDILFGNEHEVAHLTGCSSLSDCIAALQPKVRHPGHHARSRRGNRQSRKAFMPRSTARPIERVVDTTGAGDFFAAGFLAGRCSGRDLERLAGNWRDRRGGSDLPFRRSARGDLKELVGL